MTPNSFRSRTRIRLGNLRSIRGEMVSAYRAWVYGQINDEALRAGTLALTRLAALDTGQLLDQRVAELERRLAGLPAKPNGHDAASAHP
jgi:hypothetical protein